jgi:pimeloyl-ACP methyl ester carboxylesterase
MKLGRALLVALAGCAVACAGSGGGALGEAPGRSEAGLRTNAAPAPLRGGPSAAGADLSTTASAAAPGAATQSAQPGAPPARTVVERSTWAMLPVEGFASAVVVEPPDDGRARPLIVATHGAGGRPEAHCERWEEIVQSSAFIACTRGRGMNTHLPEPERGYFYDGHHELGRELDATFVALEQRHGARIDTKAAVFAGYSQGAAMGILALHEKPERAARFGGVVLVEGGTGDWNVALSERMVKLGVRRVAFVCGQASCIDAAETSKPWLARAGLPLRIEYARGAGHTYRGAVGQLVEQAFAWVVEGDTRFLR